MVQIDGHSISEILDAFGGVRNRKSNEPLAIIAKTIKGKGISFMENRPKSFVEIWMGQDRRRILRMMESSWDINNCRINCRMDEINRYLWDLKFPPPHVNFI